MSNAEPILFLIEHKKMKVDNAINPVNAVKTGTKGKSRCFQRRFSTNQLVSQIISPTVSLPGYELTLIELGIQTAKLLITASKALD